MDDLTQLTSGTRLIDSVDIINNNFNALQEGLSEAGKVETVNGIAPDENKNVVLTAESLVDLIYPVGSIYTSTVETSPAVLFGKGTWERIGQGRCLIDAGDGYEAGSEGGSADAVVPYHTHTFTGSAVSSGTESANHSHSGSTGTISADHTHSTWTGGISANHYHSFTAYQWVAPNGNVSVGSGNNTYSAGSTTGWVSSDHSHGVGMNGVSANHTHSFSTGGVSANHTHSVTATGSNSYAGEEDNIIGANMQPYLAVYMWKRTA